MWLYTLSSDQTSFLQFSHGLNNLKATNTHSTETKDQPQTYLNTLWTGDQTRHINPSQTVSLSHRVCGRVSVHVVSEFKMTSGYNEQINCWGIMLQWTSFTNKMLQLEIISMLSQIEADTIKCNLPLYDCVKNIDLFVFCIQVLQCSSKNITAQKRVIGRYHFQINNVISYGTNVGSNIVACPKTVLDRP